MHGRNQPALHEFAERLQALVTLFTQLANAPLDDIVIGPGGAESKSGRRRNALDSRRQVGEALQHAPLVDRLLIPRERIAELRDFLVQPEQLRGVLPRQR